jgi:hypothetical protein
MRLYHVNHELSIPYLFFFSYNKRRFIHSALGDKIPNSKHQVPNNNQITNHKTFCHSERGQNRVEVEDTPRSESLFEAQILHYTKADIFKKNFDYSAFFN